MDVFISWSGKASHKMAETLVNYLPDMIQEIKPFISTDIQKGSDWDTALSQNLRTTKCGIFCITPDNTKAPWLLFEAGAISVNIDNPDGAGGLVMTLLLNVSSTDLDFPLARFQATNTLKPDFLKLLLGINGLIEKPLEQSKVKDILDRYWPDIETGLNDAKKLINVTAENTTPEKTDNDMLKELVESSRSQDKALSLMSDDVHRIRISSLKQNSSLYNTRYNEFVFGQSKANKNN